MNLSILSAVGLANRLRKLFAVKLLRNFQVNLVGLSEPEMSPWVPFQHVVGEFPVQLMCIDSEPLHLISG